jgi:glycosyltransferase involved in cell wall biosynthesis
MNSNHLLVSVIITTRNEELNIANCLKSVFEQSYRKENIEVVVVDNNSTDRTKKIAEDYRNEISGKGLAPLNIAIFNRGPERSVQRNFGAEKSSGKYIIYLDADMVLSPGVISECVDELEKNKEIVALYVPEIIMGKNFWNKTRRFERSFYDGTVIDAVRFIRKDVFLKIGGFDETLTGPEDWDLDKKIKKIGKIGIIKNPLYHNEGEFAVKKYLKKKAYYGQNFQNYIAKWGKNDEDIKRQFGAYYRFFGVFTENGKWHKIVRHPLLTGGMLVLRFFVGLTFLAQSMFRSQSRMK